MQNLPLRQALLFYVHQLLPSPTQFGFLPSLIVVAQAAVTSAVRIGLSWSSCSSRLMKLSNLHKLQVVPCKLRLNTLRAPLKATWQISMRVRLKRAWACIKSSVAKKIFWPHEGNLHNYAWPGLAGFSSWMLQNMVSCSMKPYLQTILA